MYSVKELSKQEPSSIAAVMVMIFNVLVLAGVLHIDPKVVEAADAIAVPLLSLFYVRPNTVSKDALNKLNGNGNATVQVVPPSTTGV